MANDKILLIGGGYLGSRIEQQLALHHQIMVADVGQVDITDFVSVERLLKTHQPGVVINAAALTNTHEIEKPENRTAAYRVNVQGPAHLAFLAHQQGFHLVHLSTGMIFDGTGKDGQGFREEDLPNPSSFYAWTKAWADMQLAPRAEQDHILITRLHTPLSAISHPKNLLNKMCGFDQGLDAQSSMTVVEDLLRALEELIAQRATGIYHVVNPGTISFYEIMQLLQEKGLIPAEKKINKVTQAELDHLIDEKGGARQPVSVLNTDKLQAAGIHLRPIRQAVTESMEALVTQEAHGR